MAQATDKSQSYREVHLWLASRKYITGELEISELEKIERGYTQDFKSAMVALSKRSLSYDFFAGVRKIGKLISERVFGNVLKR